MWHGYVYGVKGSRKQDKFMVTMTSCVISLMGIEMAVHNIQNMNKVLSVVTHLSVQDFALLNRS